MAVETVVKSIGSTGVFSTLQLWEDGGPAALTTAERSAAGTFLVAAFVQGEALSFVGSGATGKLLDTDSTGAGTGTYVTYGLTAGNVATSDVCTGGTSGATCIITSGTPDFTGVIWQGQCQNQEFTGTGIQCNIAGSTNSSTTYKQLTTVAGASFRDNADVQTNALRYNAANGCGVTGTSADFQTFIVSENNARVSKLQIAATGAGGIGFAGSGSLIQLEFLIVEGTYVAGASSFGALGLNGTGTLKNSVVIQRASAADHIIGTGTGSPFLYNVTVVAPDDLATPPAKIFLSSISGTVTVQNCGMFAGGDSPTVAGSATFNFTTCYGDDSTPATGITTATYADQFEDVDDATRDFRLKSGADMFDTGTTDTTNAAIDIAGTARPSGAAYDVGCWELVVAAAEAAGFGPLIGGQRNRHVLNGRA